MKLLLSFLSCTALTVLCAGPALTQDSPTTVTAAEYLRAQEKPVFRTGHTLPRLTRFGWVLPYDARVEFARDWGYALELGGYWTQENAQKSLSEPQSDNGKAIALAAAEPLRFPLGVIVARDFPKDLPDTTWVRDADGRFTDGKNVWGKDGASGGTLIWSPAAPDRVFEAGGDLRAKPLRLLRARAPVAVVLNGGEYAVGVPGAHAKQWEKDPYIVAQKGDRSWFQYVSERKGRQEKIIADRIRAAVPDRQLYIFYNTGSEAHRNRYAGWEQWAFDFAHLRAASDLPSNEFYYRHFNSGWTGDNDALTQALNTIGYQIVRGAPLSYNWLCAGWTPRGKPQDPERDEDLSDIARYTGFLKTLYVAGMIGGNAGYYTYPKGGFDTRFAADRPPHWLQQMTALGHIHAFASYLDRFTRASALLPGPDTHRWSKDQPAYEFATGQPNARVVARKHAGRDAWLIGAWIADGEASKVTVDIPLLGSIEIEARPAGSVYHAVRTSTGQASLTLLDVNALAPTTSAEGRRRLESIAANP